MQAHCQIWPACLILRNIFRRQYRLGVLSPCFLRPLFFPFFLSSSSFSFSCSSSSSPCSSPGSDRDSMCKRRSGNRLGQHCQVVCLSVSTFPRWRPRETSPTHKASAQTEIIVDNSSAHNTRAQSNQPQTDRQTQRQRQRQIDRHGDRDRQTGGRG